MVLVMRKTLVKECKRHGVTEHAEEATGYYRCKKCRNEHVIKARQDVKRKIVEDFGGKCKICGYSKWIGNLIFHHLDPSKKEFAIGNGGSTISYEKIKREASKCLLVCCRCHGEIHAGLITI